MSWTKRALEYMRDGMTEAEAIAAVARERADAPIDEPLRCDVCGNEVIQRSRVESTLGDVWAGPCCLEIARRAAGYEAQVKQDEESWARIYELGGASTVAPEEEAA